MKKYKHIFRHITLFNRFRFKGAKRSLKFTGIQKKAIYLNRKFLVQTVCDDIEEKRAFNEFVLNNYDSFLTL